MEKSKGEKPFESKSNNSYYVRSVFSHQQEVNKLPTPAICLCFARQVKVTSKNEFSAWTKDMYTGTSNTQRKLGWLFSWNHGNKQVPEQRRTLSFSFMSYWNCIKRKNYSHFHEIGNRVRLSANVELSKVGTSIIKLDSIAQNTTVIVQESSFKTERILTLKQPLWKEIKSMSLWWRLK